MPTCEILTCNNDARELLHFKHTESVGICYHHRDLVTGRIAPAENMALTIALAQIKRGDEVPPNTTAVLIFALERLTRPGTADVVPY